MRRGECGLARPRITRLDISTLLEGPSARAGSSRGARYFASAHPYRARRFCGRPTLCDFSEGGGLDFAVIGKERVGVRKIPTLAKPQGWGTQDSSPRVRPLKINAPSGANDKIDDRLQISLRSCLATHR